MHYKIIWNSQTDNRTIISKYSGDMLSSWSIRLSMFCIRSYTSAGTGLSMIT